jgi:hypothetical protein
MSFVSKKLWQSVGAGMALAAACLMAPRAHAAGIEDTVTGAVGLGRGAYFVSVNDFMAVMHNPANLAVVPGGIFGTELRLPVLQACYTRQYDPRLFDPAMGINKYKQDAAGNLIESFKQECNKAFPSPTANLGWARSYKNGLGWGIGLFTPAASGNSKYGNGIIRTAGDIEGETFQRTETGITSSTRQMGIERRGVIAHLMLGIGWQPVKQFRMGVSAGPGFAEVYNKSVVSAIGGTFSDPEVINELTVRDLFVPRATASVVVSPFDSLDILGVVKYQADIVAKGHTDLTANGIKGAPRRKCSRSSAMDPLPGTHCRIDGVELTVPLPTIEATAGLRYAYRRVGRERVLDPMKDEVFDLEVNATWSQTSHVKGFEAQLHNIPNPPPGEVNYPTVPQVQFNNAPTASLVNIRQKSGFPKNWKDTWTFAAGGDWNVLADRLTLRLGGSYATRAVDPAYMNLDYFPVRKIGAHLGGTLKLNNYRFTLAYAHFFMEEIVVPVGTGKVLDISSLEELAATAVNEGKYWASLDVFSVQFSAIF